MLRILLVGVCLIVWVECLGDRIGMQILGGEAYSWQAPVSGIKLNAEILPPKDPKAQSIQSATRTDAASPPDLSRADALFQEGEESGNFLPAIEAYKTALKDNPNAHWAAIANWRIAKGYQRMGHYHEAAVRWGRALEVLPPGKEALEARFDLAECLYQVNKMEEAMASFGALSGEVTSPRDRAWSLFRYGDCLMESGLRQEARVAYLKAQVLKPDARWIPVESLCNMARLALESNQPERACWPIMTALSLYPDHPKRPEMLYLLGEIFAARGKLSEANLILDQVRRDYPQHVEAQMALLCLATIQFEKKGQTAAPPVDTFSQDWADPSNPVFHLFTGDAPLQRGVLRLGKVLFERGDQELAFRLLLNAKRGFDETAITPLMVENLLEMARDTIHEALLKEQHSKVIQRFDTLTRWLPEVWNDEQILYDVGVSYEELGFYETADAIYKRVHHHEGQRGGDWRTALALMRVELALGRGENALNLLGEIPSDQSWKETAKGLLEWAAVDRSPGAEKKIGRWLREIQEGRLSPESIVSVGRWYIDQGAYQKAADFLETALSGKVITGQEGSILAEACCLLGDVLRHLGRSQEAMAQYEKVLRREPWGFLEKWAAYRTLQVGREMGVGERGRPYLERLFQEPEGGLWRRIAEYLDQGMTPVGKKEDASWS